MKRNSLLIITIISMLIADSLRGQVPDQKINKPATNTQIPLIKLPPIKNEANTNINPVGKIAPAKVNYVTIPNKMYTPDEIANLSLKAPVIAALTVRTPYYPNAVLSCLNPFSISALTNNILMFEEAGGLKSILTCRANLAANKKYLCIIKYQGQAQNETTATISQNNQDAQDIHLRYEPFAYGEFSFIINSVEPGWRNVDLSLSLRKASNGGRQMLVYINEWNIKELAE